MVKKNEEEMYEEEEKLIIIEPSQVTAPHVEPEGTRKFQLENYLNIQPTYASTRSGKGCKE